jgi:hypothetical protein
MCPSPDESKGMKRVTFALATTKAPCEA